MLHDDDAPVGRVLTRREVLISLGAAGAAALVPHPGIRTAAGRIILPGGATLPTCIVRPAQTEGPYFVEERLERSDIRSDPSDGTVAEGVPLLLAFRLSRLDGAACAPLAGAVVDVWQCDALGVYSDVRDFQGRFDTRGKKFLRGHQISGPDGFARFVTIYPGWYEGRTVHIHFKIRTDPGLERGVEFVSQLYFDDALSDRVFAEAPYASKGPRAARNEDDGIFRRGGRELMLDLTRDEHGYTGTFDLGLQMR